MTKYAALPVHLCLRNAVSSPDERFSMDITQHNASLHYIYDGAGELPIEWRKIDAVRIGMRASEWLEHVSVFLRRHASLIGTPRISTRRTELYYRLSNSADLEQISKDVTILVIVAETRRVGLGNIDSEFSKKLVGLFPSV
jgi:hypothetical protein